MNIDLTKYQYPGFVTVRTTSSRLPNKCLLPLGNETVISHVIKRARLAGIEPIVCTSTDSSDDILAEIASELGAQCFRGSLKNKLDRWLKCAEAFGLEYFHTIDADDPFFDADEVIASLDRLVEGGYDVIYPSVMSAAGAASVGYSLTASAVRHALTGVDSDADTEMMWFYLEKVENLRKATLPDRRSSFTNMRLTLDYEEDYWLMCTIVRILGNSASRDTIEDLFQVNPDLHLINFFRNEEWKKAQDSKRLN